jgi:hypothetical protein
LANREVDGAGAFFQVVERHVSSLLLRRTVTGPRLRLW